MILCIVYDSSYEHKKYTKNIDRASKLMFKDANADGIVRLIGLLILKLYSQIGPSIDVFI